MLDVTFLGAAVGGLLSFLSPCILPIVPFYLSYMAGVSMNRISSGAPLERGVRLRAVLSTMAFSLGVIVVFMLYGAGASALGQLFAEWLDYLRWIAGAVILAMGLHFLGVIRIGILYRQLRAEPGDVSNLSVMGAFVVGLAFAFGWTPCIGPPLTAVLTTAAGAETALQGSAILFVFGAGMTFPFVLAAVFIGPFLRFMARFRRYMGVVEKAMGVMLIIFAVLIATDSVSYLAEWMVERWPDDQMMWCSWEPGRFLWEMSGGLCLDPS